MLYYYTQFDWAGELLDCEGTIIRLGGPIIRLGEQLNCEDNLSQDTPGNCCVIEESEED